MDLPVIKLNCNGRASLAAGMYSVIGNLKEQYQHAEKLTGDRLSSMSSCQVRVWMKPHTKVLVLSFNVIPIRFQSLHLIINAEPVPG